MNFILIAKRNKKRARKKTTLFHILLKNSYLNRAISINQGNSQHLQYLSYNAIAPPSCLL